MTDHLTAHRRMRARAVRMTLAVMVVSTALEQLIFDRARESGVGELLRMVSNACRIRVRDVGDYPQEDDGVR